MTETVAPILPPHGLGDLTDTTVWPEDRVTSAAHALRAELERRYLVATAPAKVEQLVEQYQVATGQSDGQPWVAPAGAHNAYRRGAIVTHGGKRWESLIGANPHQPGDPADPQAYRWWKDLTPIPDPGTGPAAWNPNGHPYKVGDLVTFGAKTYRVLQAHPSQPGWTPVAVPALWQVV